MRKIGMFMVCMAVFGFLYAGSARAVDVKFSGTFDVAGMYEGRPTMDSDDASTAFFFQELNLRAVFEVAPGLSLTTKIVALTKIWGDTSWTGTRGDTFGRPASGDGSSGATATRARENIEIQEAYLTYNAGKVGTFRVGYVPHDTQWGTIWGTSERPKAIIQWGKPVGDFSFGLKYIKNGETSATYKGLNDGWTDGDGDIYVANVMYKKDFLFTGFKYAYLNNNVGKPTQVAPGTEQRTMGSLLTPFVILTFGPVKIEAEAEHFYGKQDGKNGNEDIDYRTWSAYLNAEYAPGPFTLGATYAYASGDDPATKKREAFGAGPMGNYGWTSWGGLDYNPGLILWNEDRNEWRGPLGKTAVLGASNRVFSGVANAHMVSLYGSYKPTESWDLKLVWLFAKAAELPVDSANQRFVSKTYGHEADFIATYKITNNLKYMVGAGYLWAGDYFKGASKANKVSDDYLFTNKLTLTF